MNIKLIFILIIITVSFSCKHEFLGEQAAKEILQETLQDTTKSSLVSDTLIKDKETATKIAEIYLFNVYGKKEVLNEKPYEIYLINGFWVILGTLPDYYAAGGTFEIIINSKNGEVIRLIHGK